MPRTEIIMTSFSSFYCWPTLDVMCRRRSVRRPSVVRPCTLSTECDRRNLFITLIIVRCPSSKRNKARLRASFYHCGDILILASYGVVWFHNMIGALHIFYDNDDDDDDDDDHDDDELQVAEDNDDEGRQRRDPSRRIPES